MHVRLAVLARSTRSIERGFSSSRPVLKSKLSYEEIQSLKAIHAAKLKAQGRLGKMRPGCQCCYDPNHNIWACPDRLIPDAGRTTPFCSYCGKKGDHWIPECAQRVLVERKRAAEGRSWGPASGSTPAKKKTHTAPVIELVDNVAPPQDPKEETAQKEGVPTKYPKVSFKNPDEPFAPDF